MLIKKCCENCQRFFPSHGICSGLYYGKKVVKLRKLKGEDFAEKCEEWFPSMEIFDQWQKQKRG